MDSVSVWPSTDAVVARMESSWRCLARSPCCGLLHAQGPGSGKREPGSPAQREKARTCGNQPPHWCWLPQREQTRCTASLCREVRSGCRDFVCGCGRCNLARSTIVKLRSSSGTAQTFSLGELTGHYPFTSPGREGSCRSLLLPLLALEIQAHLMHSRIHKQLSKCAEDRAPSPAPRQASSKREQLQQQESSSST